jgi:hypothetical protein
LRSLRFASVGIVVWLVALTSFVAAQEPVADGPPYEMDTYYVAFLKRGPGATGMPKEEAERVQAAHMAHNPQDG